MNKEQLTVAEFRKNVKAALDFCVQGGAVEIDRMGQKFVLMYVPRGMDIMVGGIDPAKPGADKSVEPLQVNPKSHTVIEESTPKGPNPFPKVTNLYELRKKKGE